MTPRVAPYGVGTAAKMASMIVSTCTSSAMAWNPSRMRCRRALWREVADVVGHDERPAVQQRECLDACCRAIAPRGLAPSSM